MRKCALCAAKIPSGGIYCPACGKKVESAITFDYREEDEREFAFHAEYYGAAGTNRGEQQMLHDGSRYAWNDGKLYYLYEAKSGQFYVLKIENEEITDSFEVTFKDGVARYDMDILANRNGIFCINDKYIALYKFSGEKQFEIDCGEAFDGKCQEYIYYIFGDKIYFLLNHQEKYRRFEDVSMCIKEYNFKTDTWQDIWDLAPQIKEESMFCAEQLCGQMEEDIPSDGISIKVTGCNITSLYANSQYMIISYALIVGDDGDGYEIYYNPVVLFDFATKKYEMITRARKEHQGLWFDMRRNKMWYVYNQNTLAEVPLKRMCDVQKKEAQRTWTFADIRAGQVSSYGSSRPYFDGEHCYVPRESYFLYAYQQDGKDVGEWNRSSHGNTKVAVHGPYVWARLDMEKDDLFPHAIHKPGQGFHVEEDAAEQVIEQSRSRQEDRNLSENISESENPQIYVEAEENDLDEAGQPEEVQKIEEMPKPEEMWKPEEVQKPEEIQKREEPEEQNRGMTISGLRAKLQECSDYAGEFKAYRNSLENRWDFNAVMGILIGSNKRSGGKKHILEQNAGIGQGDNFNRVVEALERHGLMDVYKKYEKMTDASVTLLQLEDEIMEIAPQLSDICKKISDILV